MVRIIPPQPPATGPTPTADATENRTAELHPAQTGATTSEGYTRTGPGPIAAIRMRWTARPVGSITFVVDEVMGDNGTPVTSRPMSREAAIKLIDERAQAASIAAIRTAESSRTVFRALGTVTPCLCYA